MWEGVATEKYFERDIKERCREMRGEKQKGLKLNNLSDSHTNKPQMLTDCYLYNGGYIKKSQHNPPVQYPKFTIYTNYPTEDDKPTNTCS